MTNNTFDKVKIQFEKFLSLIGTILTCEKELHIIQNKLRRHFNTTVSDYLCSNEFLSALEQIQNIFLENNKATKFYTLLASFDEQLKKHSIKSLITTTIEPVPTTSLSEVQETIEYLLDQCCNIVSETVVKDNARSITTDSKHQRRIIRLERRLSRLSRIIRELEEKDMSLDEMAHCDLYEVESNLKKQFCHIHARLAELKSEPPSAERIINQPITLNESETGHPLINKDLEEMVNQSKNCPCFTDVLDIVEKANNKYKLNLNDETRKIFAEKSFKIIGKEIKNRRMADFHDIMYSRLPENFSIEQNDPALNNAEIEQVLLENQREAVIKTDKIFEEFSQIEPDQDGEINLESTEAEESTVEPEEQQEMEYDAVDILPPFTQEPLTPIASESNSIEAKVEISLNDRTLTILSTASLPIRRTTYHRETEICHDSRSSSIISKECQVETLIPRHTQNLNDNDIIYKLYKQRLTNNKPPPVTNKRSITKTNEYTNVKKSKQQHQQPELIVLD